MALQHIRMASCTGCSWLMLRPQILEFGIDNAEEMARTHEWESLHRVILWDGPTSQIHRSLWAETLDFTVTPLPLANPETPALLAMFRVERTYANTEGDEMAPFMNGNTVVAYRVAKPNGIVAEFAAQEFEQIIGMYVHHLVLTSPSKKGHNG